MIGKLKEARRKKKKSLDGDCGGREDRQRHTTGRGGCGVGALT